MKNIFLTMLCAYFLTAVQARLGEYNLRYSRQISAFIIQYYVGLKRSAVIYKMGLFATPILQEIGIRDILP